MMSVNLVAEEALNKSHFAAMSPDHSWRNAALSCQAERDRSEGYQVGSGFPNSFPSLRMRVALVARDRSWLLQNRTP